MKLKFANFPEALEIVILGADQKPITEHEKDGQTYIGASFGKHYSIQLKNPNSGKSPEKRIFLALKVDSIEALKGTQKAMRSTAGQGYTFRNEHFNGNVIDIKGWSMNSEVTTPFEFTQSDDFLEGVMFKQMQGKLFEQSYQKIEGTIFVENLAWGADEDPETPFEHGDAEQQSFVIHYDTEQQLTFKGIMTQQKDGKSPKDYIRSLAKSQERKARNIYMLAVAINDYPIPHHKLNGCINDATAMVEYVSTIYDKGDTAVHVKVLTDEDATHQNVSSAFLQHMGQAQGKDDIALFYFCGHGSEEPCPPEFLWEEPTKMNSGIVCHDSRDPDRPGRFDLADKEIRYLIWQLEQNTKSPQTGDASNIVVIMDCCHSGGGTRDVQAEPEIPVRTRKIEPSTKSRPLNTFNFFQEIEKNPEWIFEKGINLPSGRHIQMAAAHSTQTAKETVCEGRQHGVFTHFLLETVREAKGKFTYEELRDKVIAKVAKKVNDQTPEIAAVIPDDNEEEVKALINTAFLGVEVLQKEQVFAVTYNEEFTSWEIAAGTVHGLPPDASNSIIGIYEDETDVRENRPIATATVAGAFVQVSELAFEKDMTAYQGKALVGKIWEIDKPKVPIYFDKDPNNAEANETFLAEYEKQQKAGTKFFFKLTDSPSQAEYRLVVENNKYAIKKVGEIKPMVKPQFQPDAAMSMLNHVARWFNQLDISNPNTLLPDNAIKVENNTCYVNQTKTRAGVMNDMVVKTGDKEFYQVRDASRAWSDEGFLGTFKQSKHSSLLRLDYSNKDGKWANTWKKPETNFKITNTYDTGLYITFLEFNQRFGVSYCEKAGEAKVQGDVKKKKAYYLAAGETLIFEPRAFEVEDIFWKYGLLERQYNLKVIYSTFEVNPEDYLMDKLPLPDDEDMQKSTRDLGTVIEPMPDFAVLDIKVTVFRPQDAVKIEGETELRGIKIRSAIPMTLSMLSEKLALESISDAAHESKTKPNTPQDILKAQGAGNFSLGEGGNDLSVLQLTNVNPHELNSQLNDNPIQLDLTGKVGKGETVMTMIPCEDGLVLPMFAEEDANGNVVMNITQVPTEISPAGSRSLGGSLKMMMQKMVSEAIGSKFNAYPIMALADVSPDGSKMEYRGKSRRECLELIQQEINNEKSQNCILFIHGITGDTKDMPQALNLAKSKVSAAYKEVSNLYDVVMTFDYENLNTTIEENAEHLKNTLKEAGFFTVENGKMVKNPYKTLHIVAHSMGGLVARCFIEQLDGDQVADHLIMFGTPNGGSPWSKAKDMVMMALTLVLSKVSLAAWAVAPLTFLVKKVADEGIKSLKQMNPNSDFYKAINNEKLNRPQIPYTIVAGNTAKVANPDEMASTMQKAAKKLNMVLENWLFTEPHDIAVSVEYIKIKNVWEKMGRNIKEYPVNAELPADISTTEETVVIMEAACDHMSYFVDPAGLKAFSEVLLKRVNPKN